MALIKEYLELTKQYYDEYGENTILLMQNGAFFEVYGLKNNDNFFHGSQILEFARICDLNIVDRKTSGNKNIMINDDKVVNAGFKTHLIEKYIKKLQDSGFTTVVYEEDTDDDPTSKKKNRSLTGIYSPGTFFSYDPELITNSTCCIWIETKKPSLKIIDNYIYIGASQLDIYTGNSSVMEYNQKYINNPCTFDELERFISIYKPTETIIVSNLSQSELNDLVKYSNIQSNPIHFVSLQCSDTSKNTIKALNCEKQTYQSHLLNKFYKINDMQSFITIFNDNVYAIQSFCYLLDFIYQHNPNLVYKISEPKLDNNNDRLILANHSLQQLNIIDDDNYNGKYTSVIKMLNECITPMGKRQFKYNFLKPITNELYLQKEYDIIEHLLTNIDDYFIFKHLLVQIKDISAIIRQIMLLKTTPKSIYNLYSTISIAKTLYNYVIENPILNSYLTEKIDNYNNLLNDINKVSEYMDSVLILDKCKDIDNIQKFDSCFIREGIDFDLDNKIKTLIDSQDQLDACRLYFSNIISNYENDSKKKKPKKTKNKKTTIIDDDVDEEENINDDDEDDDIKSYVKIYETEKNNFSLIATNRRCKILEEAIKSTKSVTLTYKSSHSNKEIQFILSLDLTFNKQSTSNKSITNTHINLLCKNVNSIKLNLIDAVSRVYQNIIQSMQDYQDCLTNISTLITYIDLVYAKTFIANKYNYCKPTLETNTTNKSFIVAKNLRHCLIEKIQQTELYISNDLSIGKSEHNLLDGILLYGTNMVGKTSLIRALGISVVMAQAGLYVPASNYYFKPYKYIFTRILGNDNVFKGLSSFAVEMLEFRTILQLADNNSLVLGDELCSGTESISAFSIFISGIQSLVAANCCFIFATHLHEIVGCEEITALHNVGAKHMSVIYDREKDCLVYNRKLQDGPGSNMYGLEVCKALKLPKEFLENANNIRMKYYPESSSILEQKPSHFNAKHIPGGLCNNCNIRPAIDVHHLLHQSDADKRGIINKQNLGLTFNKNHKANLTNLCEICHTEIHKTGKKYKKTKTTIGIILEEI
jgi:DNA mismatch repair protein MutS